MKSLDVFVFRFCVSLRAVLFVHGKDTAWRNEASTLHRSSFPLVVAAPQEFMDRHPGGPTTIVAWAGKDVAWMCLDAFQWMFDDLCPCVIDF